MLSVENLKKSFGDFDAVNDLSFSFEMGTIFGFLGPNGAGKTTTIRILTLGSNPSSGVVSFFGSPIFDDPEGFKKQFGYVPAEPFLYELLTGKEFLNFVADMRGLGLNERNKIDEFLELFEMTGDCDRLIAGYSTGMRKKISVISALLHQPKIVFLDEPTNGLDAVSVKKLRDLIKNLSNRGVGIFLTTHILEVVEKLCDRVCIINHGRKITEGSMEEIKSLSSGPDSQLEDVFLALTRPSP